MTIRCLLDGLLLSADLAKQGSSLIAFDGDEAFPMESLEALYYELVCATREEVLGLEAARYRLLRRAPDFQCVRA